MKFISAKTLKWSHIPKCIILLAIFFNSLEFSDARGFKMRGFKPRARVRAPVRTPSRKSVWKPVDRRIRPPARSPIKTPVIKTYKPRISSLGVNKNRLSLNKPMVQQTRLSASKPRVNSITKTESKGIKSNRPIKRIYGPDGCLVRRRRRSFDDQDRSSKHIRVRRGSRKNCKPMSPKDFEAGANRFNREEQQDSDRKKALKHSGTYDANDFMNNLTPERKHAYREKPNRDINGQVIHGSNHRDLNIDPEKSQITFLDRQGQLVPDAFGVADGTGQAKRVHTAVWDSKEGKKTMFQRLSSNDDFIIHSEGVGTYKNRFTEGKFNWNRGN